MINYLVAHIAAMIAFLAAAAGVVALFRIKTAIRKVVMASFAGFMLATSFREVPAIVWGVESWPVMATALSGIARLLQVAFASLFVGAITYRECRHWVWVIMLAVAAVFSMVVS